jgi:hypothetical protein
VGALIRAWGLSDIDRDLAAVRRSPAWAQESSDRGDYADAFAWIAVLKMITAQIPTAYLTKRRASRLALVASGRATWERT